MLDLAVLSNGELKLSAVEADGQRLNDGATDAEGLAPGRAAAYLQCVGRTTGRHGHEGLTGAAE